MSGLLPRTSSETQNGVFTDLTVQTLNVSLVGFINSLVTNSMTVANLVTNLLTTPLIASTTSLTVSTGGSERFIIPQAGIVNDNTAVDVLALNSDNEMVYCDDFVDLTSTQTLTNKTLTAPIISTITNTGTLTLPTTTDTLVGRATTDILTNKTLTAPVISTITNTGTLTLPTSTTTLVGRLTTDTLSNKALDSSSNTITITSGSLSADNINNVLNQRLKTTNSPTFVTVNAQQLLLVNAINDSITVQSTTSQNNQILFTTTGPTNQTGVGYDNLNSLHRLWGYTNSPMVFATNNLERLRIPAGGIANDNTITNILGLSGTTLAYKNNVVDTSTTQTLSNKSFTDSPSMFSGKKMEVTGTQTTTDGSTVTLVTTAFATSNAVGSVDIRIFAYCTAGANINTSCAQRLQVKIQNVAGTLTTGTINNSFSNAFSTSLGAIVSGTNILTQVTGIASNTIRWVAYVTTYYE